MTRFISVPQWQGSPSARAMALADGAAAIVGDLPRSAVFDVDVPLEAGEAVATGVARASSLMRVQERIADALLTHQEPVVLIGGDCSISLPAIAHVAGDDLAVVWLDAHPDLHTPESSESGAFSGMALRALLGHGASELVRTEVAPERVILAGARAIDPAEADAIATLGIRHLPAEALSEPDALAEAVAATGAARVYVHVDLDVLDPSEMSGVSDAVPFGAQRAHLVDAIRALRERTELVGATVAGFAPSSPAAAVNDLGAILRIIGALA